MFETENANCITADPDLFFPEPGKEYRKTIAEAKKVCEGCSVAVQCLAEAMSHGHDGIWGGTTQAERLALRRSIPITIKRK